VVSTTTPYAGVIRFRFEGCFSAAGRRPCRWWVLS